MHQTYVHLLDLLTFSCQIKEEQCKKKRRAYLHVAEELGGRERDGDGEERLGVPRGDVELQRAGAVGLIQQVHRPQERALLGQVPVGPVDRGDLRNGGGAQGDAYAHVVELHGPDLTKTKNQAQVKGCGEVGAAGGVRRWRAV